MGLSDEEVEQMIGSVRDELHTMSAAERRIATRNRESLFAWLYSAVQRIAGVLGDVVSSPFKAVFHFFEGLFEGLGR